MSTDGININLDAIKKVEVRKVPQEKSEAIIEQAYDSAVSAFEEIKPKCDTDNDGSFNIGELGLAINAVFKGHEETSEFKSIQTALDRFDAESIEAEELAAQIIYSYGILFPEEKEELPVVQEKEGRTPDENGEVSEEVIISQELPGVAEGEKLPDENGEAPEGAPTSDEGKEMPADEETLNKEYQAYLERHGETGALSEADYEKMLEKFEKLEDVDLSDGYSLDEIKTIANSIDEKLTNEIMDKYQVDGDLGYALYQVENTYKDNSLEKTASMMTPDVALEEAGVNPKKAKYLKTDDDGTYYFVTGNTPGAGATSKPAIINNFYGGVYDAKENPNGISHEEYNVMMALNGINVFNDKEREGDHVPSLANIYLYSKEDIRALTKELEKQGLDLRSREGMKEIINNPDKYSLSKLGQGVKTSAEQIPEAKGQTSAGDSGKVSTEGSSGASSSDTNIPIVSEEGALGKIAADGTYKNEKAPEDSVDPVLVDNAVNTTIESVVEAVKAGNLPQSALEAAKNNENTAKLLADIVDGGKHSLRTVAQTLIASGLADSPLGKQVLETMSQGSNNFKSLFQSGLTQSIPEGVTPIAGDIMFRTTGAPCTVADVKQDDKGQNIYTVVWGGIPTGSKQEVVSGTLEQLGLAKDKYIPVGAENKKALDAKAAQEAQKAALEEQAVAQAQLDAKTEAEKIEDIASITKLLGEDVLYSQDDTTVVLKVDGKTVQLPKGFNNAQMVADFIGQNNNWTSIEYENNTLIGYIDGASEGIDIVAQAKIQAAAQAEAEARVKAEEASRLAEGVEAAKAETKKAVQAYAENPTDESLASAKDAVEEMEAADAKSKEAIVANAKVLFENSAGTLYEDQDGKIYFKGKDGKIYTAEEMLSGKNSQASPDILEIFGKIDPKNIKQYYWESR